MQACSLHCLNKIINFSKTGKSQVESYWKYRKTNYSTGPRNQLARVVSCCYCMFISFPSICTWLVQFRIWWVAMAHIFFRIYDGIFILYIHGNTRTQRSFLQQVFRKNKALDRSCQSRCCTITIYYRHYISLMVFHDESLCNCRGFDWPRRFTTPMDYKISFSTVICIIWNCNGG